MTTTITKHFVKSPTVGNGVLSWLFADGDQVTYEQPVARFTVGGNAHDIVAPATGRLKIVTPHGTPTQGGNPIGMVHEGETGTVPTKPSSTLESKYPPRTEIHIATDKTEAGLTSPKVAVVGPVVEQPISRRRGTIAPPIEVVEIVEVPSTSATSNSSKSKVTKPKAVNRTYSVGSHQEAAIAKLAKTLSLAALDDDSTPSGVNESELVRAGIELLLGLPRPALLDVLRANREREKRGKWGRGRPRPLK